MSGPKLTVNDFTKAFAESIKALQGLETLVGIPESKTARKKDADGNYIEPINNAALLYINVFGSPANNIPPRDVMTIGLRNAQGQIAEQFRIAGIEAFSKGFTAIERCYSRIGIIASNSVKRAINDQDGIDAPSEATLKARQSRGFKGIKALIVTGQMRNAITWVVTNGKFESRSVVINGSD